MIAQTSRTAYQSIQNELGDKQQAVFDTVEALGSASNEQIAEKLNWPINCVTPRVNELVYKGYMTTIGLTTGRSGRKAKLWAVCDPNDRQLSLLTEQDCGDN